MAKSIYFFPVSLINLLQLSNHPLCWPRDLTDINDHSATDVGLGKDFG